MLCDMCKKNVATIHKTVMINGDGYESHLCSECASKAGEDEFDFAHESVFDLMDDFWNFLGGKDEFDNNFLVENEKKCPKCGSTFADCVKRGKLGCEDCYNTFSEEIRDTLENMKASPDLSFDNPADNKIASLEEEFNRAIAEERYEDAGELKKKLNELKNKGDK